ncbi:MAG: KpsF/GutQ family sugar-phosphate isomerase [Chromatiaceae bacterium]|nr:KpsF/GutQ family sugar-phosphate isomerase [Gammaproteobacteria bacterium]MCP5427391.1 KpsF/GutQ family sugar-phosphate isomerase [Chromatiaceae bacterium]MCB1860452.1 KpsF/GutQ family sugar-phosphate isomerase [Gammaproteobacteria bacterium]MCB1871200.1 KpsF/GutQ family sugar-phosphate isomerase [Gammaproteobacteria bacterium]MCB1879663.1 KpsF/GutQ family sugar-phosphate isomerase [Gammaproteobacteria bacterium]
MNSSSQTADSENLKALGLAVIKNEAAAVLNLSSRITDDFAKACRFMLACEGRIVVTGMGKSGHICGKIAATLASTGSPAFFVHPGEASHGDLGMITDKDVVLALSNSGETREILTIVPIIKRLGIPLIALTGDSTSNLAREADIHIDVGVPQEACPLNLAPTSSTTAALAMGDALAIALLESRGFTEKDFARSHPGGSLGRRLLLHISDIMHSGAEVPAVTEEAHLKEALVEMTKKGLGMTAIVDENYRLAGIYTDGDLRRTLDQEVDLSHSLVRDFMTTGCKTATPNLLAAEALQIMQRSKINGLLIVDDERRLIGAINMHDLLRAGVV